MHYLFRQQEIRDLAWAMCSPPMMQIENAIFKHQPLSEVESESLSNLEQEHERLCQHLEVLKRRTVGHYFEQLVAFWISHYSALSIAGQNIQVQGAEQTIGEFDFLLHGTFPPTHLEVAVKYYLGTGNASSWSEWIGPNGKDSLERKVNSLASTQCMLSLREESKPILADLALPSVQPAVMLKGYFFYPYHQILRGKDTAPPFQSHPDHLRGWWCYAKDASGMIRASPHHWKILQKPHWLSPALSYHKDELMSGSLMEDFAKRHVREHNQCLLVAAMSDQDTGVWLEQHRGFIVPDNWPNHLES